MHKESTLRKSIAILLGLSFFLCEGLNYSQMGPFFPTEAENNKGVSTTFIGIITGAFDVANFFSAFALAACVTPLNQKFFFCTGAMLSACCTGLFGVMGLSVGGTPFIVVCTLVRALMGVGASMVWCTGVPLLIPIFPQYSGRLTSLVEVSIGLGMMIGPSVGSALYSVGGYSAPFLVASTTQIFCVVLCVFYLPNTTAENFKNLKAVPDQPKNEESEELPGFNFAYFASRPIILITCLPVIWHSACMGFLDVAIGPYLMDKFGIQGDTSGYYFLGYSAVYAAEAPFFGYLIDLGHGGRVFLLSCFTASASFAMLWLSSIVPAVETQYWIIGCLMLLGFSNSSAFLSVYLIFEKLAFKIGFRTENNAKLMTALLLNACFAVGRMMGPIAIGGVFMENYGYYYSFLVLSGLFFTSGITSIFCLASSNLLQKSFYSKEREGEKLVRFEGAIESLSVESMVAKKRGDTVVSVVSEKSAVVHIVQSGRFNPLVSVKSEMRVM